MQVLITAPCTLFPQVHRTPIQSDRREHAAVDQLHIRQRDECELGDGDECECERGWGGEHDEHHVSTRRAAPIATWVGTQWYALMTS